MPDNERKEELRNNIERWQKELDEVWGNTETDAAEVERRNLRNLINNARSELEELEGNRSNVEKDEEITPEELLRKLKEEKKKSRDAEKGENADKNRIKLKIERLKEEREDYKDDKSLYEEYTKTIEEEEKRLEDLEKKEEDKINYEEMNKNLKILTKGRMQEEAKKTDIEKAIRKKQQEIQDIEYGTEEALEDIELSDGTKVKNPKVLRLYEELNELQSQLRYTNKKIEEYQKMIDKVKGVEKEEPHELDPEEVRYFHGQGDMNEIYGANGEDTKNNRHANDEYFGLGSKVPKKPIEQQKPEPEPPQKPEPEPPQKPEPEPPQKPEPIMPEKTSVAIEKSGLQIFREQFNQMPEIEKRHTLSERLNIVMPLGMPAAAALSAFVNPFLGIPVVAGSLAAKPIAYRLTGQKRLENKIRDQFLEMNEGEFNKMVDYLSEEKVSELKPNAVILNALHKAMVERTKQAKARLDAETIRLTEKRDQILAKGKEVTESDRARLEEINGRIIEITDYTTDENGKRGPSESEIVSKRLKEVRRGKDRVSAKYKGNLATRFNIFAHRNSTTEEYYDPINDYADPEKARDIARVRGDSVRTAEEQRNMEEVLEDNTFTNGLGVQRSVFNARKGAVKIISDARDKTVQTISALLTIGIGLTKTGIDKANADRTQANNEQKYANLQNTHNNDVNNIQKSAKGINQTEVQSAADSQVTQVGTAREHAVLNKHGDFTPQYHADDMQTQKIVRNAAKHSQITGNSAGDRMHELAGAIRNKMPAANDLVNSTSNPAMGGTTLNAHGTLLGYEQDYANQVASEAKIVDKCGDVLDIAEQMKTSTGNLDKATISWIGPIITAAGGFIGRVKSAVNSKKIVKENKEIDEESR